MRPVGEAAIICPRPRQVVTWTATQSFQPRGHRAGRWCGSSYSIRPSVYQVWSFLTFPFGRNRWFSALQRLVTLIFDLLTLNWCRMSPVARMILLQILMVFCDFSLSSYGQSCIRLTTWRHDIDLWPLTQTWSRTLSDSFSYNGRKM